MKKLLCTLIMASSAILSSYSALACDDGQPPTPPMDRQVKELAGQWVAGEFLGVTCNESGVRSAFGYRLHLANHLQHEYEVTISSELCAILTTQQDAALAMPVEDLFSTRIYIRDEASGAIAFESILPNHEPTFDPAVSSEERALLLSLRTPSHN